MVVNDDILLEESVDYEALKLCLAALAVQVVHHAPIALEAAAEEVIEADSISDSEPFALGCRMHSLNMSYPFMAHGHRRFWTEVVTEV